MMLMFNEDEGRATSVYKPRDVSRPRAPAARAGAGRRARAPAAAPARAPAPAAAPAPAPGSLAGLALPNNS